MYPFLFFISCRNEIERESTQEASGSSDSDSASTVFHVCKFLSTISNVKSVRGIQMNINI